MERRRQDDKIFDRLGYIEGLMTCVKEDVVLMKQKLHTTIPGGMLIKILSVFFVAVFSWLGVLTYIIMGG